MRLFVWPPPPTQVWAWYKRNVLPSVNNVLIHYRKEFVREGGKLTLRSGIVHVCSERFWRPWHTRTHAPLVHCTRVLLVHCTCAPETSALHMHTRTRLVHCMPVQLVHCA
jgi:hypothetical protein